MCARPADLPPEKQWSRECRGCPHKDSPFRCQGKSRNSGERCKKWAIKGRKWCEYHGGRTLRGPRTCTNQFRSNRATVIYDQWLGKTLREKVTEFVSQPHDDAVSLYNELALTRSVASDAIALYSAALDGEDVDITTKAQAGMVMNAALDSVKDLVLACSKIEKDAEDKVSMKVVYLFMIQITQAIHKATGGDEKLALKIDAQIKQDVRLPKAGEEFAEDISTVSTPADYVLAMDMNTLGEPDAIDTSLDKTTPA